MSSDVRVTVELVVLAAVFFIWEVILSMIMLYVNQASTVAKFFFRSRKNPVYSAV